jgi:hypothetical protein
MKKIVFFTMFFGSLLIFSGSASAQFSGVVWAVNGSGKLTPATGDKISIDIYSPKHSEPAKGLVSGRKYIVVNICNGQCNAMKALINLEATPDQKDPSGNLRTTKVVKLASPIPVIMKGDKVALDLGTKTITISRGKTTYGKITFQ